MELFPKFCDLQIRTVCFLGAGFVGGPTAAVLAAHAPEIEVTVADINSSRIQAWNTDALPVSEPGLLELVRRCRVPDSPVIGEGVEPTQKRNLRFTANVRTAILEANLIFLCVDTPQSCNQDGLENPPDLTTFKRAVSEVGKTAVKDFIIVEKSTVPCGTARLTKSILSNTLHPGISFQVLSNPEFLAEGSAVRHLENPDRILIGYSNSLQGRHAARLLSRLYEHWVPKSKVLNMDTWSSELAKLCANALLAQRISSVNSFSMLCEGVGADVRKIAEAVKSDHRIGPHMLNASVGFGGSCFQKDIAHLVYLANSLGLDHVARYWMSVLTINQVQTDSFAKRICRRLAGVPSMITNVAILGFAFKADTNDVRGSAAIDVVKSLMGKYYEVRIYDPCVSASAILSALGNDLSTRQDIEHSLRICSDPYDACESASAVVVLTEWKEFEFKPAMSAVDLLTEEEEELDESNCYDSDKASSLTDSGLGSSVLAVTGATCSLDWARIARSMVAPRYLFDGRNVVHDAVAKHGFRIERIGKNSDPTARTRAV